MTRNAQVHLITDRERARGDVLRAVRSALRGGVDRVQVREKGGPARDLYETTLRIVAHARETGAGVLVNDRIDVALATGAEGVHLAGGSLSPAVTRELVGELALVGVSVHGLDEALVAAHEGADYVTFGHVYPTASKPGLPPLGVRELAEIVESVEVPVLAVGGIDRSNVSEVLRTGASGISVISAILTARDPEKAVRELRREIDGSGGRPRRPFKETTAKGAR